MAAALDAGSGASLSRCAKTIQQVALDAPSISLTPLELLQIASGTLTFADVAAAARAPEAQSIIEPANEAAAEAAMATLREVAAEADRMLESLLARQLFERAIAIELTRPPSALGPGDVPERPHTAPTSAAAASELASWLDAARPGTAQAGWYPRRWWKPGIRVKPLPPRINARSESPPR